MESRTKPITITDKMNEEENAEISALLRRAPVKVRRNRASHSKSRERAAASNTLAKVDRARAMLAKASTLEEVKKIRDIAEAARVYAKAAHKGREKQNEAAELALLAARKAGQILKQLQKTKPQSAAKAAGDSEYRKALKETHTPERTATYWQRLADITEFITQQYFKKIRKEEKGEITATGLRREAAKVSRAIASLTNDKNVHRQVMERGVAGNGWSVDKLTRRVECTSMSATYGAPPLSVLDLKQGYFSERRRQWERLGIRGDAGRGNEHTAVYKNVTSGSESEISVFHPALTSMLYQWFTPMGGHILDPFAGGSTRGIVAGMLGLKYTGVELRTEQVQENRKQAEQIIHEMSDMSVSTLKETPPKWICGNSENLDNYAKGKKFDLIFTCPPYYDLEQYTQDDARDLSRCKTYGDFMSRYESIFRQAFGHLNENRFVVVMVGEARDKNTGWFYNFVGDTISCFQRLGLHYYNEIIVLTPIGSAPMRAKKGFENYRKVQKVHQNVLVFWKGKDWKAIPQELGVLHEAHGVPGVAIVELLKGSPAEARAARMYPEFKKNASPEHTRMNGNG